LNAYNIDNLARVRGGAEIEADSLMMKGLNLNRILRSISENEIEGFLTVGEWVEFDEGEIVSKQSDPVTDVLFIVSGRARAEIGGGGESTFRAIVSFPEAGDDIGLLSLVDGAPHSATVTALEDVLALSVPMSALRMRLRSRQDWYRILAEISVERLRTSGLWLQSLM
jgi:CRP/FNR family transcriptional regulator, cyclic AMP receptor protein